ncbi:MAG: hypothetical protein ABIH66_01060, partial [bacterium]
LCSCFVSSVVPVLLYRSAYREQTLISSEKKTVHGSPDGQEGFETASLIRAEKPAGETGCRKTILNPDRFRRVPLF